MKYINKFIVVYNISTTYSDGNVRKGAVPAAPFPILGFLER